MGYRTILVDLSTGRPVGGGLGVAHRLADRFKAALVGLHVVPQPVMPVGVYGDPAAYLRAGLIEAQRAVNADCRRRVQPVFRDVCGQGPHAVWRDAEGDRADLLAAAARASDLVLTERGHADAVDALGPIEPLVLSAGVPVLVLPPKPVTPRSATRASKRQRCIPAKTGLPARGAALPAAFASGRPTGSRGCRHEDMRPRVVPKA